MTIQNAAASITFVIFVASIQAAPVILPTANRGAPNDAFSPPSSITILASSPAAYGGILNIFGATGTGEGDTTIFADATVGSTYQIDFQTTNSILLSSYRAVVSDDEPSNNRAISHLKLFSSADSSFSNLTLLSDVSINTPYGSNYFGAIISIYDQFPAVSAQYFRMEFVNASVSGPRILELDGNVTPVLKIVSVTHLANNHTMLQCLGVPNSKNKILGSPDLGSGFTTLSNVTANADGSFQYEDTNPSNLNTQFYQLSTREPF
jgi:hypothetical protein